MNKKYNSKKWKDTWDLSNLYKSINDPQIEKDVLEAERKIKSFVKKYSNKKNRNYLKNPKDLKQFLDDDNKLSLLDGSRKPLRFIRLSEDMGNRTDKADKLQKQISERFKKVGLTAQPLFLDLGRVSKEKQKQFINSPLLKDYKYYLETFFEDSKYQLSDKEEKILTLKGSVSSGMWIQGVERSVNKKTVNFEKKEISIAEALGKLSEVNTNKRRKLYSDIKDELKKVADYSEGEINAIVTNKKISDELRGYKKSYDTSFKRDETRAKDILPFAELVTKNFKIAHKYYKLKKDYLGLDDFYYVDRLAKFGEIKKKYNFKDSSKLLLEIFDDIKPEYAETLNSFLENGQIDAYPRKGKSGGAYQWSDKKLPTNIFLNHTNDFNSVTTFAHEMGHAIHSGFTNNAQPIQYQGYSLAVAETASTFFENFAFEKMYSQLNEKEKLIALGEKLDASVATIFRQIAAFNFELELHERIRTEGYLSSKEIADLLSKHMKSYVGPAIKMQDDDGYSFIYWSHFRRPYYVYTYSFGELISNALYESYKADPEYLEKIEEIFKAGESIPPHEIFKKAGIDVSKKEFFELGLKKIEREIKEFERLLKNSKK